MLGSTQRLEVADSDAVHGSGLEVVQRRTGGGAVLAGPGEHLWVDVWLPADDPLRADDVTRSFTWLGRACQQMLDSLGVETGMHEGGAAFGRFGRLVCFAGMGAGELEWAGRKVVGLAQRRNRFGSRFQVAVLLRWDPDELLGLLALPPGDAADARRTLPNVAAPVEAPEAELLGALRAALP